MLNWTKHFIIISTWITKSSEQIIEATETNVWRPFLHVHKRRPIIRFRLREVDAQCSPAPPRTGTRLAPVTPLHRKWRFELSVCPPGAFQGIPPRPERTLLAKPSTSEQVYTTRCVEFIPYDNEHYKWLVNKYYYASQLLFCSVRGLHTHRFWIPRHSFSRKAWTDCWVHTIVSTLIEDCNLLAAGFFFVRLWTFISASGLNSHLFGWHFVRRLRHFIRHIRNFTV